MAEAAVIYTRGDPNAPDQRGESMVPNTCQLIPNLLHVKSLLNLMFCQVERHQRKIREQKEAGAHAQLQVLMPDAGLAVRTLALESCDWDVDRARTLIKRFREVKADEIKAVKERIAKQVEQQSQGKNEVGRRNEDAPEGKNVDTDSGASSSDAENDDNSSSDEDRRQSRKASKHKRSSRKSSKKHKDKSSSKHRNDSSREDRKAKRHKKDKREAPKPKSAALTEQYGKYGIIRESDYESKRGDFQLWATEVKKVEIEVLPKWEEKELFKTYMEDFNTGTLPHKKYYDNDSYERAKAIKEAKRGGKKSKTERTYFDDEEDRRKEVAQQRLEEQEERYKEAYNQLRYTTNKAEEMREQEMLRQQMRLAYRTGNMDEARRIQERLNPDEDPNKP